MPPLLSSVRVSYLCWRFYHNRIYAVQFPVSKPDFDTMVWEGLCSGMPAKQRFEIYVCTAAERGYALEAWRVLDPRCQLMRPSQVGERLVCVPASRLKTLSRVLGLGHLHPPGPAPASDGADALLSEMPLAVIVDDRLEVRSLTEIAHLLQTASPDCPALDEPPMGIAAATADLSNSLLEAS